MGSGITNLGAKELFGAKFKNEGSGVTNFKAVFIDAGSPSTPNVDDGLFSEWVTRGFAEIAAGNGYNSGGIDVPDTAVGFDVNNEDDTNNRGDMQLADVAVTASGGPIPSSGAGARYMLLTDDNVTLSARKVFGWWDLASDRSVTDGGTLTVKDAEMRGTTV